MNNQSTAAELLELCQDIVAYVPDYFLDKYAYLADIERLKNELAVIDVEYTTAEAENLWGLRPGTVRAACRRGILRSGECRKLSRVWLVTRAGMERHYARTSPVRSET